MSHNITFGDMWGYLMASNTDHHKPEEEKFDELLNNEAFRDVFDNGFVEGLERRKAKLDGRAQKVQIAQLTVLLMLFLSLLSVHLSVSIFGVSTSEAHNLREVLLLVTSTIQAGNIFPSLETTKVNKLLNAFILHVGKGNPAAIRALNLRYGVGTQISWIWWKNRKSPNLQQAIALVAAAIGFVGWLLVAFVAGMAIEAAAIIDILRAPSISFGFSVLVTAYVALVQCGSFGLGTLSGGYISLKP